MPEPASTALPSSVEGRRVVVVEDDYMLAEDLRALLEVRGAEVLGSVPSVAEALELVRSEPAPSAAIPDINLGGEMVCPVADALRTRGIPFVLAAGCEACASPEAYADVPCAEKPVALSSLPQAQGDGGDPASLFKVFRWN